MWEEIAQLQKEKNTVFFLDWMNRIVLTPSRMRQAHDLYLSVAKKVPEISEYQRTPQSAPWHVEGPTVADGVIRMLATIQAIVEGETLFDVEEFARHKALRFEIKELEEIIRENPATLQVYSLTHDIGKPETLSFSAPSGSKGEKEGFLQHGYRLKRQANDQEKQIYIKLFKAYQVRRNNSTVSDDMAQFFDEYEISAHYSSHEKIGASEKYLVSRETVSDIFRLPQIDRAMVTWMIRNHMDVLTFFKKATNQIKFDLLVSRANKAGFDSDDVLDLMMAGTFLDSIAGSLTYQEGVFSVDFKPLMYWLYSEEQSAPLRREQRREKVKRIEKQHLMNVLRKAKLSPEEVFVLLNIPPGPDRGKIMEEIYTVVKNSEMPIAFGDYTQILAPRIKDARKFFDQAAKA